MVTAASDWGIWDRAIRLTASNSQRLTGIATNSLDAAQEVDVAIDQPGAELYYRNWPRHNPAHSAALLVPSRRKSPSAQHAALRAAHERLGIGACFGQLLTELHNS